MFHDGRVGWQAKPEVGHQRMQSRLDESWRISLPMCDAMRKSAKLPHYIGSRRLCRHAPIFLVSRTRRFIGPVVDKAQDRRVPTVRLSHVATLTAAQLAALEGALDCSSLYIGRTFLFFMRFQGYKLLSSWLS